MPLKPRSDPVNRRPTSRAGGERGGGWAGPTEGAAESEKGRGNQRLKSEGMSRIAPEPLQKGLWVLLGGYLQQWRWQEVVNHVSS